MKQLLHSWCLLVTLTSWHASMAQVPIGNSYPSASAVLFLDFDGHTVEGTSWNWTGAPVVCASSGLNTTAMQEIFNRVAEDYRPFNINVTTDSTRFMSAAITERIRVIITTSSSWYSNSSGGVAFVGSFAWGDDHPCFVFSASLNYNPKKISEAVAHESGHTFGLYHQSQYDVNCNKLTDYHSGQGDGEIGWAPIMGVGYSRNFTLWSNGPNSMGCTSYQSDLDIIASAENGFGFRPDDHSNSITEATELVFSNQQFEMDGIIHQNTDQDVFKFNMPGKGQFKLNATPYNVGLNNAGSDLDMQITLFDGSNTLLNVYNPGTLLNSVIDTTLNPGTYYLQVEGKGNINAPSYASLGSYLLSGGTEGVLTLPLLSIRLKGQYKDLWHHFSWTVDADQPVTRQTIETSNGETAFIPLAEIPANKFDFSYKSAEPGLYQYRVKSVLADGRIQYSNIISITNTEVIHKPKIIGNPVNTGIIYVNSPGNYHYTLVDLNGKFITGGKLVRGINHINITNVRPGVYMMNFNGKYQQWTDKLLRQ